MGDPVKAMVWTVQRGGLGVGEVVGVGEVHWGRAEARMGRRRVGIRYFMLVKAELVSVLSA